MSSHTPKTKRNGGFTLIELLTVIAIIGILSAILIPAVGAVRTKAAQASSSSDMRQIALAHSNFQTEGARSRSIGSGTWSEEDNTFADTPGDFARVLAWNAGLNDAPLYFIGSAEDVAELPRIPRIIFENPGEEATETDFTDNTDRISYEMARVSPNMQASITPLIWTKGLDDGTWSEDTGESPWGDDGGHIAFAAGNVEFFDDIDDDLRDTEGQATSNIEEVFDDTDRLLRAEGE